MKSLQSIYSIEMIPKTEVQSGYSIKFLEEKKRTKKRKRSQLSEKKIPPEDENRKRINKYLKEASPYDRRELREALEQSLLGIKKNSKI